MSSSRTPTLPDGVPLPTVTDGTVAIEPPGDGAGYWAGGPSAQLVDGVYYLAYRVRRPIGSGRGYANVVARSDDGVHFEVIATLAKDDFGSESLERPALVHTPDGTLAPLHQLRHPRHQALVGRRPGGRPPVRLHRRHPSHRPARRRHRGRQGRRHQVPRRRVAHVGDLPPAGRPERDRPDVTQVRHQPGRPRVDLAGAGHDRPPRSLGLPRRSARRRLPRRARPGRFLRRPRHRSGRTTKSAPVSPSATTSAHFTAVSDDVDLQSPWGYRRPALHRHPDAAER